MKNRQTQIEDEIYERHLKIAEMLEEDPALWEIPYSVLNRWISRSKTFVPLALQEWERILESNSKDKSKILDIIRDDSEEGKRLRSSSPFVGFFKKH